MYLKKRFLIESVGRCISRGGDLLIANMIMFYSQESFFLLATGFGALWNGLIDFSWQRFVVYPKRCTAKRLLRYTLPYLVLRISIAGLGLGTLSLLFFLLECSYVTASCITAVLFWYVSYQTTRVFFTGSSRGLPRWFRRFWVCLRVSARARPLIS
jgi:hypothetical protein